MTEKFEMVKIHQADILNDFSLEIIKGGIKDPNPCNGNTCGTNTGICTKNNCVSNGNDCVGNICGTNGCLADKEAGGTGECNSEFKG